MPGKLNPGQFGYSVTRGDLGAAPPKIIATFPDEPDRVAGILSTDRRKMSARSVNDGRRKAWDLRVSVAYLTPEARGTGVGQTMYNLLRHEAGYEVPHSTDLSPEGFAFAKRVGGHIPVDHPTTPSWTLGNTDDLEPPGMKSAVPIDPTIGAASAPAKKKRKPRPRKGYKVQEMQLPGEEWDRY